MLQCIEIQGYFVIFSSLSLSFTHGSFGEEDVEQIWYYSVAFATFSLGYNTRQKQLRGRRICGLLKWFHDRESVAEFMVLGAHEVACCILLADSKQRETCTRSWLSSYLQSTTPNIPLSPVRFHSLPKHCCQPETKHSDNMSLGGHFTQ